jgi:hypothetical protein
VGDLLEVYYQFHLLPMVLHYHLFLHHLNLQVIQL